MKTAREIRKATKDSGRSLAEWAEGMIRATQLDTLRWVLSDSAISDVDIRTKFRELEAGK